MKKKKFYEFNKILMIALIMSFSFLIAGIVGINVDYVFLSTAYETTNNDEESFDDSVYEEKLLSEKDIGKNVETVGSGTEEDPYIISNIDQYVYLSGYGKYDSKELEGLWEERILPEGYTQVDYISSTGGWIDAEYVPTNNTKLEFVMKNVSWNPFETGVKSADGNNFI